MAKNYSYQQPANTSSMSSSYSAYNQPQQSNNNQPQQNTSQPQRNNSQQSSYAAPQQQQQQQAAPLNMSAYSPQPQQAARIPSPGQAQGIEPRSNGTPYMPPGAVRETSDFLAPEVRARVAAQRPAPVSPTLGNDAWTEASWANRNQPAPYVRDAWNRDGRPGYDPNGTYAQVTGTAKDGTEFGLKSEAAAYDRWRAGYAQPNPTQPPPYGRYGGPQQDRLMPAQPAAPAYGNMEKWLSDDRWRTDYAQPNPTQPQQSPASGVEAWQKAGTPGFNPMGTYLQVTGVSKDGTKFGIQAMADAYDRWLEGSQGNAQPNPTQPPPNGRYGRPLVDPWMGATPENPAYDPAERAATAERIRQAQQPRFDTPPGVPLTAEQRRAMETVYPSASGPRTQSPERPQFIQDSLERFQSKNVRQMDEMRAEYEATHPYRQAPESQLRALSGSPQPGQNSYGFRGYDINNGDSIRPPDSPANAANFGGGPKPNLFSQSFTSPDGTTSDQPNFNQRDAFLNNLLDNDSENPGGRYQGRGRAPQSFMEPRPDIMGMWNKAGSMARDGWTNPVAGLMNQSR